MHALGQESSVATVVAQGRCPGQVRSLAQEPLHAEGMAKNQKREIILTLQLLHGRSIRIVQRILRNSL